MKNAYVHETNPYVFVVLLLLNQACFHQVICVFIKPINTIKVEVLQPNYT